MNTALFVIIAIAVMYALVPRRPPVVGNSNNSNIPPDKRDTIRVQDGGAYIETLFE
jgi:hypothetical protein